jgi:DNA-binding transcriptional LysR family regulator
MHLNRFDLNLLIALDALLREKNVPRAADRLFISQPAVSAALQKLRDYFDDHCPEAVAQQFVTSCP